MDVKQEIDNDHNYDNDPLQVDEVGEIPGNVYNQNDNAHDDNVRCQHNVDYVTDEIDVEEPSGDSKVSGVVLHNVQY